MARRPIPRTLIVKRSHRLAPNMLRVTIGGPELAGFPDGQVGGYVKLMLPPSRHDGKPTVRTYTIRNQRSGELDIDFVLHADAKGQAGPATRWALAAEPGDVVKVGGPGAAKPLAPGFDHYSWPGT